MSQQESQVGLLILVIFLFTRFSFTKMSYEVWITRAYQQDSSCSYDRCENRQQSSLKDTGQPCAFQHWQQIHFEQTIYVQTILQKY